MHKSSFYSSSIRPVVEHACASALTEKTNTSSRKCLAACAANNFWHQSLCDFSLVTFLMSPLCDQHRELCKSLFRQIVRGGFHIRHYLLPATCNSLITDSCDSDQQSHFQYFTHGLLASEIPFLPFALITNQFSIDLFPLYFVCTYA